LGQGDLMDGQVDQELGELRGIVEIPADGDRVLQVVEGRLVVAAAVCDKARMARARGMGWRAPAAVRSTITSLTTCSNRSRSSSGNARSTSRSRDQPAPIQSPVSVYSRWLSSKHRVASARSAGCSG
jgi:hypothetical protein